MSLSAVSSATPATITPTTTPANTVTSPGGLLFSSEVTSGDQPVTTSSTISSYQANFLNLQQYDTSELLYASFLSPSDSLANFDSVLGQAATLLNPSSTDAAASATTATDAATTAVPPTIPSVSDILAASDQAAQSTLSAYAAGPAGGSIIDYQA